MTFHLLSLETLQSTHSIVAEFTGDEKVAARLGFPGEAARRKGHVIIVTLVDLPNGKFARLKVDESGLNHVLDLQAYLETALTEYATLTVGDTIRLNVAGRSLLGDNTEREGRETIATVLELAPEEAIKIVNVDLEADIVYSTVDESPQSSLLGLGSTLSGDLNPEFPTRLFKVELPPNVWGNQQERFLKIELASEPPGSADLFASFFPLTTAFPHVNHFSNFSGDAKVIEISKEKFKSHVVQCTGDDDVISPSYILIGVNLFGPASHYRLTVNRLTVPPGPSELLSSNAFAPTSASGQICQNCGRVVPESSIQMHELHCSRFLAKCTTCNRTMRRDDLERHVHCPKCDQPLSSDHLEKHLETLHREIKCGCGKIMEAYSLAKHQSKECCHRLSRCRFCGLFVRAGQPELHPCAVDIALGLLPHESICGSKTNECPVCGVFVMKKVH